MTFDTQTRQDPCSTIARPMLTGRFLAIAALLAGGALAACTHLVDDPNGLDVTYNAHSYHFAIRNQVRDGDVFDPDVVRSSVLIDGIWVDCDNRVDCEATVLRLFGETERPEAAVPPPPAPVNEGNDGGHSD